MRRKLDHQYDTHVCSFYPPSFTIGLWLKLSEMKDGEGENNKNIVYDLCFPFLFMLSTDNFNNEHILWDLWLFLRVWYIIRASSCQKSAHIITIDMPIKTHNNISFCLFSFVWSWSLMTTCCHKTCLWWQLISYWVVCDVFCSHSWQFLLWCIHWLYLQRKYTCDNVHHSK